ncbi:MAG: condensation domain-containing protein, partial [Planctomycetota bacterium]
MSTLEYLVARGPELQTELAAKTEAFVQETNTALEQRGLPVRLLAVGSQFFVAPLEAASGFGLLYGELLRRGVYFAENRVGFLSTAHTPADVAHVREAIVESARALAEAGFLTASAEAAASAQAAMPTKPALPANVAAQTGVRRVGLTEPQRQLWLEAQLSEEGLRAWNELLVLRISGDLDVAAFRTAIEQLVERHESLRTTFSADGDDQFIHPAMAADVRIIDLATEAEPDATLQKKIEAERLRAIDLGVGPVFRASIFTLGGGRHVLALKYHHLIIDGSSMGLLLQELVTLYAAISRGEAASLRPALSFSDWASEQNELREGAAAAEARNYWLSEMKLPDP